MIKNNKWDLMVGHVWQCANTMFKNPTLEKSSVNMLKTALDISKMYRSYMMQLPTTHIHGEVQKRMTSKLMDVMCNVAKQLRSETTPSPFLRLSPFIFYLNQIAILDKKILFPEFSVDNIIERDELEMKGLLETFYSGWDVTDAKMVIDIN